MTDLNDALGTLETAGEARTLRFERRLKQSPARVWAAITTPERIEAWLYVKDVVIEPRVGGRFAFHFTNTDHLVEGVVSRWEPQTTFEHSFGDPDSLVCWTVAPDGDGARLTLVHRIRKGADHMIVLRTLAGWHDVLAQLVAADEGRERGWDWSAWAGFQRQYADIYGWGDRPPADVTYTGDLAEIRFERRLNHPVAKVWAALTDPERLVMWFADMDPRVKIGEAFDVNLPHAPQYKSQAVLTAFEPERLVAWDWDDSGVVRFELEPDGEGTRLLLIHNTPKVWDVHGFGAGWHVHLDALHRLLDVGQATDIKHDVPLERVYKARFKPPAKA